MPKAEAKWKTKYKATLSKMTNNLLWVEFLDTTQPDDYDGGFTNRGGWMADESRLEMERRLIRDGWLIETMNGEM